MVDLVGPGGAIMLGQSGTGQHGSLGLYFSVHDSGTLVNLAHLHMNSKYHSNSLRL